MHSGKLSTILLLSLGWCAHAQDPVGVLEGDIRDASGAVVSAAAVTVTNHETGFSTKQLTTREGVFHFSFLPAGEYDLRATAVGFAPYTSSAIRIDIGRTVRVPLKLEVATGHSEVNVSGTGATVDTSQTLGNVVSELQAVDLPLNGRDLTQLGLLQPGVAPMTAGLAEAGGIARSGQAYAVNGQRPESNNYLLDGASNVDSVNGGYAMRVPVDAVSEFRILTLNAPAEYGETSGATTSVVTKSGSNAFTATSTTSCATTPWIRATSSRPQTEPLHRNQYGATLGGPIRKDKDFFFLYYEGQRDSAGETQAAIVPTAAERTGDFSGLTDPATGQPVPLINYFTGQPFPGNMIPSPCRTRSPKGGATVSAAQYRHQRVRIHPARITNYDQGGFRLDHYFGGNDQLFCATPRRRLHELDPLPIAGARRARFSGDRRHHHQLRHHSPGSTSFRRRRCRPSARLFPQRVPERTGRESHAGQQPRVSIPADARVERGRSLSDRQRLRVAGQSDRTGPQNTYQNDYQGSYSIAMTRGRHNLKFGADLDAQQINVLFGIATNGFFVFAPFPASDSFASFLLGQSVQFFQGGGQFDRGLRKWVAAGYAQDEWRISHA
jgi:hypothetical protein